MKEKGKTILFTFSLLLFTFAASAATLTISDGTAHLGVSVKTNAETGFMVLESGDAKVGK